MNFDISLPNLVCHLITDMVILRKDLSGLWYLLLVYFVLDLGLQLFMEFKTCGLLRCTFLKFNLKLFYIFFLETVVSYDVIPFSLLSILSMQLWWLVALSLWKVEFLIDNSGFKIRPKMDISFLSREWCFFWFAITCFRCFSSCCHPCCQKRCCCRRNESERLCLAWSRSYICCSYDRGVMLFIWPFIYFKIY